MKILITGGSGFVGTHLSNALLSRGHHVTAIGTRKRFDRIKHDLFRYLSADTTQKGPWQDEVQEMDAVINLAGKSIIKRWNESYKKLIYDSRILTTRHLVEAMPQDKKIIFCSTSAIGYYEDGGDTILTENSPGGDHFLAQVCRDWEQEALQAQKKGARVIITRFGVVVGKSGGVLAQMLPAFRMFVGGPLGDGMQWFPWIHIDDLTGAMLFVMENEDLDGAFNFCAPNPIRNRDLTRTLGEILNRPTKMATPKFMLRLAMGEFGDFMLISQRSVPERLLQNGFEFKYPNFKDAVSEVVQKR